MAMPERVLVKWYSLRRPRPAETGSGGAGSARRAGAHRAVARRCGKRA